MVHWQYLFQEANFFPHQWRQLLDLALTSAIYWDHLDFRLFFFGSYSRNQDEFIVIFILRRKFIFLFFENTVRILSLCEFSWSFGLQPWCTGSILFKEAKFSPHQWRQLLELALVLNSFTIWISACLYLAHIVEIRMNSLSVLFWDKFVVQFFKKAVEFWAYANSLDHLDCSHGALAVFYERKQISLPINEGSCWNLPIQVLISLTIWISDYLFLAHIVEIRISSLSNLFQDGSSSSFFLRNLFKFWAYANFLEHLDCSHGALAVFIPGSQFLSKNFSPINEGSCWTLPLQVLSSLTIWISDCSSLAHIVKIRMNSLSVLFRDGGSSSYFFKKAVLILSLCKFSWSFGLQSWCIGSILFKAANFTPINEGSC